MINFQKNLLKMENKILKKLTDKIEEEEGLREFVINELIDIETDEEIKGFVGDTLQHGCQSGIVSSLIYYKDTNDFFDKFENEIEDLITQNMEEQGIKTRPLFIEGLNGSAENQTQEKNLLCWFVFEETLREINQEFKINEDYF